jgi:hypothetical protein
MVFAFGEQMKRNPKHQTESGGEPRLQHVTRAAGSRRVFAVVSCLPGRLDEPLMAAIN